MNKLLIVILIIMVSLAGCEAISVDEGDEHHTLLEQNRALWRLQGIDSYQYRVTKFCYECRASGLGEVKITVQNNRITNVEQPEDQTAVPEQYWIDYDTIDELFDLIGMWAELQPAIFEVEYHRTLGYPVLIEIDSGYNPEAEVNVVDSGVKVKIEELYVL